MGYKRSIGCRVCLQGSYYPIGENKYSARRRKGGTKVFHWFGVQNHFFIC